MIDSLLKGLRRGDVFAKTGSKQVFFTIGLYMRRVNGTDVIFGGNMAESRFAHPIIDSNDLSADDFVVMRVREYVYAQPESKLNLFNPNNVVVRESVSDSYVFVSADKDHAIALTPAMVYVDADRRASFVPDDQAQVESDLYTLVRACVSRAEKNAKVSDVRKDSAWFHAARECLTPKAAGLVK